MSGAILHVEVVGKDQALLQDFYGDLLGWDLDTDNQGGYGMHRQGELTAGIGATPDGSAGHVTFYVKTDDPHAAIARAEAKGGRVVMPYAEVAPEVKFALVADPEGHIIGMMEADESDHGAAVSVDGPPFHRAHRAHRAHRGAAAQPGSASASFQSVTVPQATRCR